MDWIWSSLQWYFMLFTLGIVFLPITKKLFPTFIDHGYAFSKTIAVIVISYTAFIFGLAKVLPFTRIGLLVIIGIFGFISYSSLYSGRERSGRPRRIIILLIEELLFFASFFFLIYVRGQEPSIRGLEKFMDFGFINSILRSTYFPPLDMWFAGEPINYYYFGHLTGAVLIKLSGLLPSVGYNLILATIFAQAMTSTFSFVGNIVNHIRKVRTGLFIFFGFLGSAIVNLSGNFHAIYLFSKGYPNESPIPFWQILSWYDPTKYWYPNATRFIPFTIHEFPSYSYVVADLHGHVFDIPFVLLTLTLLFTFFFQNKHNKVQSKNVSRLTFHTSLLFGFMTAVHYMTNAIDGPLYLLLTFAVFLISFGFRKQFWILAVLTIGFFIAFVLPFSLNFAPFTSGIGVNCAPQFLVNVKKFGPFLFEAKNCQVSPFWMLGVLWGFFWLNALLYLLIQRLQKNTSPFIALLFIFGTFLILIPEFFYIKDIYPAHFRANTMFKLGYQAFIMMGIASTIVAFYLFDLKHRLRPLLGVIFLAGCSLVLLYPFSAFPGYYGALQKTPEVDGDLWLKKDFPANREIINYLNTRVIGQPIILEAQGDSYTDYNHISSYTGLPTVGGWWVHEWLWRGSADILGKERIPDIGVLYESTSLEETRRLIAKYRIQYVIVSKLEREKYKNLSEEKFSQIGTQVFRSSDAFGTLYKLN